MKKLRTEVAVVGGGPAGLSAAAEAARAGAKVLLIDENKRLGGQLVKQIHKFFGSEAHHAGVRGYQIARRLLRDVEDAGVTVASNALAYGLFPEKELGVVWDGKHCQVSAERIVLAAGAKENYLAFPGSTLPGVMGAGAAQTMANINRVLPGRRIVMLGSGNVGLIVSYQLMQAGADVVAVVEGADHIGGYGVHAAKLRRAGVPFYLSHTVTRASGDGALARVEIVQVGKNWQSIPGTELTLEADTLCLAAGLNPMTELAWMAGCAFLYLPAFGGHVPAHDAKMETTVPGVYVAGDITGVEEASTAMEEGRMAGLSAAESLGYGAGAALDAERAAIQRRLDDLRAGERGAIRRESKARQTAAAADQRQGGGAT